jgi:GT2 family glycosyltransferase
MKKLSIITVNYNSKELVKELVSSINKSEVDFGIKIIVVENSQEDLSDIAGITYLKNKGNLGFSNGNNLGVTQAVGEYVWFLNPDTTVDPDTIAFMLEYMDKHPEVGVATPKVVLQDGRLDKNCRRRFPTPLNSLKRFLGLEGYFINTPEDWETEVDSVMGSSLLVRRVVGEKIGWWDEDYFMYGEDLEFCWQVKHLGFKVMYVPNVIVRHHHGASSGLKQTSQHITKANNEIRKKSILGSTNAMRIFYKKHYSGNIFQDTFVYLGICLLERIRLMKWRV